VPTDLKARKVKMPRGSSKKSDKDIEDLDRDELVEELGDQLIEDGVYYIDEEDMNPFELLTLGGDPLSKKYKTYDWTSEDGENNFFSWIEDSRAGIPER